VEFVSKTRSDAHATCARVTFLAPKSKLLATNPTKARPAGPKKLRPALGGRLTRPLIGPHFSSFRGRFHGFSTIHVGQQVCALPFCARSRVRVARGRARITPAPGGNQPLQIGAAITSHPRRPRMAERVERHPGIAIGRDHHPLFALGPLNGRQAAGRDLGIEEKEIPMAALMEAKHLTGELPMRL